MLKKYLTYEDLWTTDLNSVKDIKKLKEALEYHFNIRGNYSRKKTIELLEEEKRKKEKVFSLVLEIDASEKIVIPFINFQDEKGFTTFLAHIDSFTVNFSDEKELISFALKNKTKFFSDAHSSFLDSCMEDISFSDMKIKVIQTNNNAKYNDFFTPVYSDNNYLCGFLKYKSQKKDYRPIYPRQSSYYTPDLTIGLEFENKVERDPVFLEFAKDKLKGNIWPFNKTLLSGAIKDFCEGVVLNSDKIFQKYKNIRIASILLNEYERKHLKTR